MYNPNMLILGIETSCDEPPVAIVEDGIHEIASVLASSADFSIETGGIVPEVAARKQLEFIIPVISKTLEQSHLENSQIDAIAVTVGPGLIGSLIVGVESAKALSFACNKPLIAVNHLIGHIYGNFVDSKKAVEFPALVLVVSGGHTDLVLMKGHGNFEYIGGTLDDAAGETFDKTARLLGISPYYGGAALSKVASECKESNPILKLPRPIMHSNNFDFSFSGLKTAVRTVALAKKFSFELIAKEFEEAIVEVLVFKTIKAAKKYDAKSILLGGGVSANRRLREVIEQESEKNGFNLHVPPLKLCADSAVYIASAGFFNQNKLELKDIQPNPSLGIADEIK